MRSRYCPASIHALHREGRWLLAAVRRSTSIKKRRISLSLKRKETTEERFAVVEEKELEEASKGVVPLNTKKNNTWAVQNFNEWALSRNSRSPDDPVPEDLLSSNDADVMCKWLCLFVMETHQKSGCPYPPSSLYSILCSCMSF